MCVCGARTYHGETSLHEEDEVGGEKHEGGIHGAGDGGDVVGHGEATALDGIFVVGAEDGSCREGKKKWGVQKSKVNKTSRFGNF